MVFVLVALLTASHREDRPGRLRESLLIAAAACSAWVVAGCEVLSLGGAFSFRPVLAWWLVPGALVGWLVWRRRASLEGLLRLPGQVPWGVWVPIGTVVLLVLLAGIVAALSPPNTYDVMRYHLPRQVFWMQQGGVQHVSDRGGHMSVLPPLAEFIGLHFMVLSRGDWYATIVQWFAYVLTIIGATLVARELGARPVGQAMAGALVAANPMAWLQASSAKNDLVGALWVMVLAWCAVRAMRQDRCGWQLALLTGVAAGLALLTKPTAVIFALPLGVVTAIWLVARTPRRIVPLAGAGAVVLSAAIAINVGHGARNLSMFGVVLPDAVIKTEGRQLSSETHAPAAVASGIVKNVALHMGSPWPRFNASVEARVRAVHDWIGWDINDERTSVYGEFSVRYGQTREELAAAPVHVLLLAAAIVAAPLIVWRSRRGREVVARNDESGAREAVLTQWLLGLFLLAVLTGFVLFCALLKWQPWHTRLHTGWIALAAPLTAAVLVRGRGIGAIVVCVVLLAPLAPTALWNQSRPMVGARNIWTTSREEMLDRRPPARVGSEGVVDFVRRAQARTVGIVTTIQGPYPMQRRMLTQIEWPVRVMHPLVPEEWQSKRKWPAPDVVIHDASTWPRFHERVHGTILYYVGISGPYRLYASRAATERLAAEGYLEELPRFID